MPLLLLSLLNLDLLDQSRNIVGEASWGAWHSVIHTACRT
jgi:hypothetical protein